MISSAPGASYEAEGRLILLINGFTTPRRNLQGRTKLAKLDFLLRYPSYLRRALIIRGATELTGIPDVGPDIETKMIRYRYGPWDPAYFVLLGRLIGRNLVTVVPGPKGLEFRATDAGREVAHALGQNDAWTQTAFLVRLLREHFDLTGTTLKKFVYENFPEVVHARWGERL